MVFYRCFQTTCWALRSRQLPLSRSRSPNSATTLPWVACSKAVPLANPLVSASPLQLHPPFHLAIDLPLSCRLSLHTIVLFRGVSLMRPNRWDSHLLKQRAGTELRVLNLFVALAHREQQCMSLYSSFYSYHEREHRPGAKHRAVVEINFKLLD